MLHYRNNNMKEKMRHLYIMEDFRTYCDIVILKIRVLIRFNVRMLVILITDSK